LIVLWYGGKLAMNNSAELSAGYDYIYISLVT